MQNEIWTIRHDIMIRWVRYSFCIMGHRAVQINVRPHYVTYCVHRSINHRLTSLVIYAGHYESVRVIDLRRLEGHRSIREAFTQ